MRLIKTIVLAVLFVGAIVGYMHFTGDSVSDKAPGIIGKMGTILIVIIAIILGLAFLKSIIVESVMGITNMLLNRATRHMNNEAVPGEPDPEVQKKYDALRDQTLGTLKKNKIKDFEDLDSETREALTQLKCKSCAAALDKNSMTIKAGNVLIDCPHCGSTYRLK